MTHMRHAYEEILCQGAALSSHLYVFSCCFPLLVFLCVSSLSVSLFVFVWAWPAQLNTYQPAVSTVFARSSFSLSGNSA